MEHAGVFKDYTEYKRMTNKKTGKDYIRQRELVTLTDEAFDEILSSNERRVDAADVPADDREAYTWGQGMNAPTTTRTF